MTSVRPSNRADGALSQANARLEEENARLRALLLRAGADVGPSAKTPASHEEPRRPDEALLAGANLVQRILEATPGITVVFDLETQRSIFANRAVADVLGYEPAEIAAMGDQVAPTLMHPDDLARFPAHLERVRRLRDDEAADFEHRMRARTGEWHWFRTRDAVFSRNTDGAVSQIIGASTEITAQRQAEEGLREGEAKWRRLFEQSVDAILVSDTKGRHVDVNDAASRMLGYDRHELLARTIGDIVAEADIPRIASEAERLTDGAVATSEWRLRRKDGAILIGEVVSRRLPDGRIQRIVRDITERRQAEDRLRQSEARFRAAFHNSSLAMSIVSQATVTYLDVNTACADLFGLTRDAMIGRTPGALARYEDPTARAALLTALQRDGFVRDHEVLWRTAGGPSRWYLVSADPIVLEDEPCVFVVSHDITDRKLAEQRLRDSEAFTRTLFEASPDCLKVIDAEGRLEYVNRNGACLLEVEGPGAVVGQPWESLWPDAFGPQLRQSMAAARAGQLVEFSAEGPTAKGTAKHWNVSIVAVPSRHDEPVRLLATSRDVTDRARTAAELTESEARYRAAVDAVDGIVWTNNAVGEMRGDQPGWSALTGQTHAEYQGFGWSQAVHPDDAQPTIEAWNAAVAAKGLFEFEHRVRRHDGAWRYFSVRAVPTFDKENRIAEWVGVHTDITPRKDAEAHRVLLMRELAHRSKNQLSVIQGVASQTARTASTLEEFRRVFARRLQGMAISADLLIAQQWDGAPLGDLVRRQLEPFGTDAGRLLSEGPDVFLDSDAAESIGLALHELATNCVKYGAWSVPAGVVRVSWSLQQDGAQPPQLRLSWLETGGPAVTAPSREGFGRRVVERMVAQKLGGTVEMKFDVKGVSWTLSAPHTPAVDASRAGSKAGGRLAT